MEAVAAPPTKKGQMNPEIKKKWVAALRANEQAQGYLKKGNAFCALGSLVNVYIEEHPDKMEWTHCGENTYGAVWNEDGLGIMEPYTLPAPVREWAGLTFRDPDLFVARLDNDDYCISNLNDEQEMHADQIATLIEEQF